MGVLNADRVATPFWFFCTKGDGNILTRTPLMGVLNADRVDINRDSRRISGYQSMTAAVQCEQQLRLSTVQFTTRIAMHQ